MNANIIDIQIFQYPLLIIIVDCFANYDKFRRIISAYEAEYFVVGELGVVFGG